MYIGYLVGNNIKLVMQYSHQVTVAVIICLALLVAVYVWVRKRGTKEAGTVAE
jgi:membrane protein DedA with SNARE-associated domain